MRTGWACCKCTKVGVLCVVTVSTTPVLGEYARWTGVVLTVTTCSTPILVHKRDGYPVRTRVRDSVPQGLERQTLAKSIKKMLV